MLMFDNNCISAVKKEIQRQLDVNEAPVTRKTVVKALNLGLDPSGNESKDAFDAAELGISVMFKMGLLPEFRTLQKLGIKPVDYVSKRQTQNEPKRRTRKKKDEVVESTEDSVETEAA